MRLIGGAFQAQWTPVGHLWIGLVRATPYAPVSLERPNVGLQGRRFKQAHKPQCHRLRRLIRGGMQPPRPRLGLGIAANKPPAHAPSLRLPILVRPCAERPHPLPPRPCLFCVQHGGHRRQIDNSCQPPLLMVFLSLCFSSFIPGLFVLIRVSVDPCPLAASFNSISIPALPHQPNINTL